MSITDPNQSETSTPARVPTPPPRGKRNLLGLGVFVALVASFVAITFSALNIAKPPPIQIGKDTCASCGMTIEDARFAASRLIKSAPDKVTTLLYDDLGCMLDADRASEGGESRRSDVQDFNGTGWIEAKRAWFVFDAQKNRTPMSSGIVAFREQPAVGAMTFDQAREARHAYMKAKYGGE